MSARTTAADVELRFFDFMAALANLGDPSAGNWADWIVSGPDETRRQIKPPTANPLWALDLVQAGCRYRLENSGGEYYIRRVTKISSQVVWVLGRMGEAKVALEHLTSATHHAITVSLTASNI